MPSSSTLAAVEVEAALAELAQAPQRTYYDAAADGAAADAYYRGVAAEQMAVLVRRAHVRAPGYQAARELCPWVDLQPTGWVRSLCTGQEWDPAELIRADLAIARARERELAARLAAPGARTAADVQAEVEAALPFNCEHTVPQSWFGKQE